MRENFSLLTKVGRKCFFRRGIFGDSWARKFVVGDTIKTVIQVLHHE